MAKRRAIKNDALSLTIKGELMFTLELIGQNDFAIHFTDKGKLYLIDGYWREIPKMISDRDILNAIYEVIELRIFNSSFAQKYYAKIDDKDLDIPF